MVDFAKEYLRPGLGPKRQLVAEEDFLNEYDLFDSHGFLHDHFDPAEDLDAQFASIKEVFLSAKQNPKAASFVKKTASELEHAIRLEITFLENNNTQDKSGERLRKLREIAGFLREFNTN